MVYIINVIYNIYYRFHELSSKTFVKKGGRDVSRQSMVLEERPTDKRIHIKRKHVRKQDKYLNQRLNSLRYVNLALKDLKEEELFYV